MIPSKGTHRQGESWASISESQLVRTLFYNIVSTSPFCFFPLGFAIETQSPQLCLILGQSVAPGMQIPLRAPKVQFDRLLCAVVWKFSPEDSRVEN